MASTVLARSGRTFIVPHRFSYSDLRSANIGIGFSKEKAARRRPDVVDLRFWALKPTTFIDIGANAGLYSCIAVTAGGIPKAIAFEPDHRNSAMMQANLM